MSVICLCGIEHEIDADTELVECAACGQRFDLGKPRANIWFSQPMTPAEFMDRLTQLYLHERRN